MTGWNFSSICFRIIPSLRLLSINKLRLFICSKKKITDISFNSRSQFFKYKHETTYVRQKGKMVENENFDIYRFDAKKYFSSPEQLILQKLIANCGTKVHDPLMQPELEKILAISKLCAFIYLFF